MRVVDMKILVCSLPRKSDLALPNEVVSLLHPILAKKQVNYEGYCTLPGNKVGESNTVYNMLKFH